MAKRIIENKRADGDNLQKNKVTNPTRRAQEYAFPPTVAQCIEDRDAINAALDTFIQCLNDGFELPGRSYEEDMKLQAAAQRVRERIG